MVFRTKCSLKQNPRVGLETTPKDGWLRGSLKDEGPEEEAVAQ